MKVTELLRFLIYQIWVCKSLIAYYYIVTLAKTLSAVVDRRLVLLAIFLVSVAHPTCQCILICFS